VAGRLAPLAVAAHHSLIVAITIDASRHATSTTIVTSQILGMG
jgi:hypothetical protein